MEAITTEQLFYLYGLIPVKEAEERPLETIIGIDDKHEIYTRQLGEVLAVMCRLDAEEYSETAIEEKMNDLDWLKTKAYHHHETLATLHESYTLVPLKFCTIYKSEENLALTIEEQEEKITRLFAELAHKEEWNLKIYCEDEKIKEEILIHSPAIKEREEEIAALSPGRQFFEKKKLKNLIDQETTEAKRKSCDIIHEQLGHHCSDSAVKKNWSQEMTGRKQDMNWNGVYLIPKEKREEFIQELQRLKESHAETGFTMEYTGPWPCYYFANL
jgi:hypothetical protein